MTKLKLVFGIMEYNHELAWATYRSVLVQVPSQFKETEDPFGWKVIGTLWTDEEFFEKSSNPSERKLKILFGKTMFDPAMSNMWQKIEEMVVDVPIELKTSKENGEEWHFVGSTWKED